MKIKFLFFMNIVMSADEDVKKENLPKLYTLAFESFKNRIENDDTLRIIERIYPKIFDEKDWPRCTEFNSYFYSKTIPIDHVDLSYMNIERIPVG